MFSPHVMQPCEGDYEVGSRNLIEVRTRDVRGGPLPGLESVCLNDGSNKILRIDNLYTSYRLCLGYFGFKG